MVKQNVRVINKLGLHARAATKLVNEAAGYDCEILLCRDGQQADAKSIMGIMMLAASQGTELELVISGTDERSALHSIVDLFENRFGEDE
ncbi:MAG: HPr family phosphocarrier protein [Arenicellales bacterium]|nr:HPr family phosphocarrier protein [Arenicellales bacterium]